MERGPRSECNSISHSRSCTRASVQCAGRSFRPARSRRIARRQGKLCQLLAVKHEQLPVVGLRGSDDALDRDSREPQALVVELQDSNGCGPGTCEPQEARAAEALPAVLRDTGSDSRAQSEVVVEPSVSACEVAEEAQLATSVAAPEAATESEEAIVVATVENEEDAASPRCAAIFSQPSSGEEDQLVRAFSEFMQQKASSPSSAKKRTSFHSQRAPKVSLHDYAKRIQKYFQCTQECYVLMSIFIDRIMELNPDFEVCDVTRHRLLFTCAVVAVKYHDDTFAGNNYYARVGGISTQELNSLEVEFLHLLDWKLYVSPSEYTRYSQTLLGDD